MNSALFPHKSIHILALGDHVAIIYVDQTNTYLEHNMTNSLIHYNKKRKKRVEWSEFVIIVLYCYNLPSCDGIVEATVIGAYYSILCLVHVS